MFVVVLLSTIALIVAITLCERIRAVYSTSKSVQKRLKRISQLISLHNWENAEKELDAIRDGKKAGKETALFEVQIFRGKGQLQEALAVVESKKRLFPEELLFRFEEGKIFLALERAEEALDCFHVCAPILRGEDALFSLASALCMGGHYQESLDTLIPLLQTTQNGCLFSLAGDAQFELRHFSEAITSYTQALKLECKTHHVFLQLGHAYRRFGNLLEAEKIFRTLLDKNSLDIDATLGLGACMQERGQHHKALLIYQTLLSTQDSRLFYQAAYAALRIQKYRFAEECLLEVLQTQAPDPQTLSWLGICLEKQKKWQEAEQLYSKLIRMFPDRPEGYRAMAWMFGVGLTQTISSSQGMNFAHRALKLKNDLISWEIFSACAAREGQFEKAYQIQIALAQHDTDAKARIRRQQVLRTLRKKTPLGDSQVLRTQVA